MAMLHGQISNRRQFIWIYICRGHCLRHPQRYVTRGWQFQQARAKLYAKASENIN